MSPYRNKGDLGVQSAASVSEAVFVDMGTALKDFGNERPTIRLFGGAAQVRKTCGFRQASEPLSRAPVPQETQPIREGRSALLEPLRLGPGEEMQRSLEQSARRIVRPGVCASGSSKGELASWWAKVSCTAAHQTGAWRRKRDTPAVNGAGRRSALDGAAPNDLGPGGSLFQTG